MSAVLVGRFEPGSKEWLAARAHGLGGSEIAPVLGLSPYESRFSLWHRKAGLIGPVEESEIMEAGKRLEPAILQKFADLHPEFYASPSMTFQHADRPWQIANPDAVVFDRLGDMAEVYPWHKAKALAEAKFALYDDGWGEPGTDEIPIHYRCQVQWYLDVFDLDLCYVMVFIGSQGVFREYVVRADADDQQHMRDAAIDFLSSLQTETRPDIDAHDATYQVIKELHPDIELAKVDIPADIAIPFCQAKAAEKAAKAVAQKATAHLADFMGNAKTALFADQTIANRQARGDGAPYVVAARNLPTFNEQDAAA